MSISHSRNLSILLSAYEPTPSPLSADVICERPLKGEVHMTSTRRRRGLCPNPLRTENSSQYVSNSFLQTFLKSPKLIMWARAPAMDNRKPSTVKHQTGQISSLRMLPPLSLPPVAISKPSILIFAGKVKMKIKLFSLLSLSSSYRTTGSETS